MTARPLSEKTTPVFTDMELWNMDYTLAAYLAKGIREFRQNQAGHPGNLDGQSWNAILDEMADGFATYANDDARDQAPLNRSLDLLRQWFPALWW